MSSKAASLTHLQVSQFEDTLHLRQKETITGLLSVLLSAPAMRLNSSHSLNSIFQLLSNALTAFPAPTPFLNKSACFSIIRGVRSKSGVLAFLRNQYFLPARWLSFLIYTQSCHQCPVSVSDSLLLVSASFSTNTQKNVSSNTRFLQTRLPSARL